MIFGLNDKIDQKITIRSINTGDAIPYHLLVHADETIEAIDRYVYDGEIYLWEVDNTAIAAYVLKF